ncbi:MAG: class I SAM-dependent methyltransferase [Patescibacteria group bacterium]|nr:class I SAM-dependent methyltransferase [Patescibacteria group bacterium]
MPLEKVLDLSNSQTSFWHCPACGAYPVFPVPKHPASLYTKEYFEGALHSKSPQYAGYLSYDRHRDVMRKDFAKQFKPWIPASAGMTKKVLDIGCATGTALEAMRDLGVPEEKLYGIDVSAYAIDAARRHIPRAELRVEDATRTDLCGQYDFIALLDILEHVENPAALMAKAVAALAPEGKIMVSTPDPESFARLVAGARWSEFHAGEHICFVSASWFSWIAKLHKLRIISLNRHGKHVTLEHALTRLRAYIPFFPLAKIRCVLHLNMFDRLCIVLEKLPK